MALPSFLCIGATKAGTTWLNEQLEQHPGVCMPVVKELHYFSALESASHRKWALKAVSAAFQRELRRARQGKGGEAARALMPHLRSVVAIETFSSAWYRACFERPDKAGGVAGEITPAYAELSDEGVTEVVRQLPQVRIIHILRHPVDRALSHLRMAAYRRDAEPSTQGLLALLAANDQIFTRGDYQNQLPRWRRFVPPDRTLIVPFGRVREAPAALLAEVEDFIGVPHFTGYVLDRQVNSTRAIDIPPEVLQHVTQRVQPALDFLQREFGPGFVEASR